MDEERVSGTTDQQAIDLTQTDSDDDMPNDEADVDERGALKRVKIDTSSAAPAADSSGGEGCSTTLTTVSEEVVDMTRTQALDMNLATRFLKPSSLSRITLMDRALPPPYGVPNSLVAFEPGSSGSGECRCTLAILV